MKKVLLPSLLLLLAACASEGGLRTTILDGTLIRTGTADPCLVYDDGSYYLTMTGASKLVMVKDSSLARLGSDVHPLASAAVIYDSALDSTVTRLYGDGAVINGTWSPEIHYFSEEEFPGQSGWYLYLALRQQYVEKNGTGSSRNVRMVVLKSSTGRVDGPYASPLNGVENQTQPMLDPDGSVITRWALGPSVLRVPGGPCQGTYLMWVEETGRGEGLGKFYQKIMVSHLASPWQLAGEPGVITTPTQEWETHGSSETHPCVVEGGTAVYGDDGEVFLTYSGSGYWSDYGLGQLTLLRDGRDGYHDPLQTGSWVKYEGNPVFSSADSDDLRGAGHGFFLRDAGGARFFCYHAYPFTDGVKAKARNAYLEPYAIDKEAACPSAPEGVLRMGKTGTATTTPVHTQIEFKTQGPSIAKSGTN
ncbi:MAG: family 43 glycosylhydrolase [Bacteroidales bacterium]|nr:family 43 glycosylhydrolase [Bacteroidales bacterium]